MFKVHVTINLETSKSLSFCITPIPNAEVSPVSHPIPTDFGAPLTLVTTTAIASNIFPLLMSPNEAHQPHSHNAMNAMSPQYITTMQFPETLSHSVILVIIHSVCRELQNDALWDTRIHMPCLLTAVLL